MKRFKDKQLKTNDAINIFSPDGQVCEIHVSERGTFDVTIYTSGNTGKINIDSISDGGYCLLEASDDVKRTSVTLVTKFETYLNNHIG